MRVCVCGVVVVVVVLCSHLDQFLCFLLVNASPFGYYGQVIRGPILQVAPAKTEVPDVCKTPFGVIVVTLFRCWRGLEGEGGRGVCWLLGPWGRQWPACESM